MVRQKRTTSFRRKRGIRSGRLLLPMKLASSWTYRFRIACTMRACVSTLPATFIGVDSNNSKRRRVIFLLESSSPPTACTRSWLKIRPPKTSVGPGFPNPAFSSSDVSLCAICRCNESARPSMSTVQSRSLPVVYSPRASEPNTTKLPSSVGSKPSARLARIFKRSALWPSASVILLHREASPPP